MCQSLGVPGSHVGWSQRSDFIVCETAAVHLQQTGAMMIVLTALQRASGAHALSNTGLRAWPRERAVVFIQIDPLWPNDFNSGWTGIVNVVIGVWVKVRGGGSLWMENTRVNTRRDQGVLAESGCTAVVLQCVAWSFWLVELCRLGTLSMSFSFSRLSSVLLLIDRERLQRCPVLEWLLGKPIVSLAFSSFCAVCPPPKPAPLLVFLTSICCFLCSPSSIFFHLPHPCIVPFLHHLFSLYSFICITLSFSSICLFLYPLLLLLFLHLFSLLFLKFLFYSSLPYRLPIPTGRGCSPLTWPLRP